MCVQLKNSDRKVMKDICVKLWENNCYFSEISIVTIQLDDEAVGKGRRFSNMM